MLITPVNSYQTACTVLVLHDRRSPARVALSKNWSMNWPLSLSASPKREMKPDSLPSSSVSCTNSPSRKKEYIPEGSSAGEAGFAVCWAGDAVADCRASAKVNVTSDVSNTANTTPLRIIFAPVVTHHCTPPQVGERATSHR